MALTQKDRSALYEGLISVVDEEAVEAMLSNFPMHDIDELVTKDFLRAELSELRSELRSELTGLQVRLIRWNVGTFIAFAAVMIAAVRL